MARVKDALASPRLRPIVLAYTINRTGEWFGLLALVLTWIAQSLINRYVIHTIFFDARVAFLGLLFGALIGLLGSAVSVGRHLRRV